MPHNPATSLEEVIQRLETIASEAEVTYAREGYFALLYARMTRAILEAINRGYFEDAQRMRQLDVAFANRYFAARAAYHRGEPTSQCWQHAFETAKSSDPLLFQHLILGINAHINLDLGIASAELVGPDGIVALKDDFMRVNSILRSLVELVQDGINDVSPAFKLADWLFLENDEEWFAFALENARDAAWTVAQDLAALPKERWQAYEERLDAQVTARGRRIKDPGTLANLVLRLIRFLESGNVPKNLQRLRKIIGKSTTNI